MLHRVLVVHAVDLGGFEDGVGTDLVRAQGGGVVGRAVGVARAGDEDDDATAREVTGGAPLDERFGDAVHRDGGHDADFEAGLLEAVHEGEAVDDRGEHAHVVARRAVGAVGAGAGEAAEDVAATDHHRDLGTEGADGFELLGQAVEDGAVDGLPGFVVSEGLTADLEDDTAILRLY